MVDHAMGLKLRQELRAGPLSDNAKAQVEAKTCWFSVFQLSITLSTLENRKTPNNPNMSIILSSFHQQNNFRKLKIQFSTFLFFIFSIEKLTDMPNTHTHTPSLVFCAAAMVKREKKTDREEIH